MQQRRRMWLRRQLVAVEINGLNAEPGAAVLRDFELVLLRTVDRREMRDVGHRGKLDVRREALPERGVEASPFHAVAFRSDPQVVDSAARASVILADQLRAAVVA